MLSIGPTKAANTRRLLLAAATGKSMSGPRWDRLAPLTTMPWAKASSPRSSASSRHGKKSPRRRRRRLPASVTLKPSIARSAERSQIPTPLRLNSKPRDSWADLNAQMGSRYQVGRRMAAVPPSDRRYWPRSHGAGGLSSTVDHVCPDGRRGERLEAPSSSDINKAPIPVVDPRRRCHARRLAIRRAYPRVSFSGNSARFLISFNHIWLNDLLWKLKSRRERVTWRQRQTGRQFRALLTSCGPEIIRERRVRGGERL